MSKSFAAAGALIARDRGLLDLDAPITAYVPEFRGVSPTGEQYRPPTVRMLLSMSGGLTEDNSWVDPFIDTSMDEILTMLGVGLTYSNPPGAVYEYSNLGYTLAGLAVTRAVGCDITEFVRREIFVPLGLTRTWYDNAAPASGYERATGYSLNQSGNWVGFAPAKSDAFAAAGGMQSTVRDLATWVRWLGAAFRPEDDDFATDVLSRASRREMQRLNQIDIPMIQARPDGGLHPVVGGYGLGLRIVQDLRFDTLVSHSGGLPGFILHMTWHPDTGHGIVALTNSHRGDAVTLAQDALNKVLTRAKAPARTVRLWPATVALRQATERLIRHWSDELADEILAKNVDFDRPLVERRAEIERLIADIGPLGPTTEVSDMLSATTGADVTWAIPGRTGELIVMIHLTPIQPSRVQEFEVIAVPYGTPRSTWPTDISVRRGRLIPGSLSPLPNHRIVLPPGATE
jgi:CubicO group peptidase (beta-lactamase class C family)